MADEITPIAVSEAEAHFAEAKSRRYADPSEANIADFRQAKADLVTLRSAFRIQEVSAGRRAVGVGIGDASVNPDSISSSLGG